MRERVFLRQREREIERGMFLVEFYYKRNSHLNMEKVLTL